MDSSSPADKDMIRSLMTSALEGNLELLKSDNPVLSGMGKEADKGEGLRKTYERVKDSEGRTVLHFAASGGKTRVCKYLIEHLKLDVNLQDGLGQTPLCHAILGQHLPTTTYLIEHGADLTLADNKVYTALHCAAAKILQRWHYIEDAEVDAKSFAGTPLHCAAAHGKKEAVKILLDNKANPNSFSNRMYTPLISSILAESFECMKCLLKAGADPNIGTSEVTPLLISASEGQIDFIKYLSKAGADANVTNFCGLTPLEIAALHGNHEAVMILFPVTTRIPTIPEWTTGGVVRHVHSEEAKKQRELKKNEKFLLAKLKGADAIKKNDYLNAIYWYTEAIGADPSDATVLSNRSLCWARLNEGTRALTDAEACISLKPEWPKAYYRAGVAYRLLKRHSEPAVTFNFAVGLDPDNPELQAAFREAAAACGSKVMGVGI